MSTNMFNELDTNVPLSKEDAEQDPRLCWYVIHTYSGYENKVMDTLKKSVENSEKMQNLILDIRVPTEEVDEIRNGKRVRSQRKVYPGYVMIRMIWTTESWYLVRNTRGVTGFVGPESKPVALSPEDAEKMLNPVPSTTKTEIAIGQEVKVLTGAMKGFTFKVEDINLVTNTVQVRAKMLGREQTLEMPLDEVAPAD